jgi:hypothetical protein
VAGSVTPEHLIEEHGVDPKVLHTPPREVRGLAARQVTLHLEMQHAADHAARKVGHTHD